MKKVVAIIAVLVLMTSASFGQEFVSSQSAGAKAILFTWNGLAYINATSYMGGFGFKLFLSDYMAMRGMVELGIADATYPWSNPLIPGKDGERSASALGVGAAIEYHLSKGRVSPFIGGGVSFTTVSTEQKDPVAGGNQMTVKNNMGAMTYAFDGIDIDNDGTIDYMAGTTINISLIIGAEYYITNGMSLSAEYQIGFQSIARKDETDTDNAGTNTFKGPSGSFIGISSAGFLTLAVYL
jgi:opacity protein-like surface antigen